jgi:hypothetical protein
MECACDGTMFTDLMCKPCLRKVRDNLTVRIETLQEKIDDLESDLDQVLYHLGEE